MPPVTPPPSPEPTESLSRPAFNSAMMALVSWYYTMVAEFNAAITALNFNSTNSTSTTSVAIGTGSKSFTAGTGKSYVVGMTVKIANSSANWLLGEVTSYDSGTGALVVNVRVSYGSGTYTSWVISLAATEVSVGDHVVTVHTGNGYASTKTKFRRYTTVQQNIGTAITYADSAANGASFTINETGLYEIYTQDVSSAVGASKNNAGTANISTLAITDRLIADGSGAASLSSASRVVKLVSGDVINPHQDGAGTDTSDRSMFSIRKVASL